MTTDDNPYAPPIASTCIVRDERDASWYLRKVQQYYRRMGIAMMAYVAIVAVVATVGASLDGSLRLADMVGPLVWCSVLTWLFMTMI